MQQSPKKLIKVKNFTEFKDWIREYNGEKNYYVLLFSSLGGSVKDLYLLNSLKKLFLSKKVPHSPLLIVDSWDAPEVFSYFDTPIIDKTPTLLMVSNQNIKVSSHLSFIEDKLVGILV